MEAAYPIHPELFRVRLDLDRKEAEPWEGDTIPVATLWQAIRDVELVRDEIVRHLGDDVTLTLEIEARSRDGYDATAQRTVNENAATLGLAESSFEE